MTGGPRFPLLERLTAAVLLLVVAALGWVVVAADQPQWAWARLASVEVEVAVVLGLLVSALLLVSVLALRHTRG